MAPHLRTTSPVWVTLFGAAALLGGASPVDETTAASPDAVGTIEGTITVAARPARRTASRYPGGDPGAHALQDIPVVVYLEGRIPGAPAPAPGSFEIAQRDTTFVPPIVVVPLGSTVDFPNEDPFFHNVFSYSPAKRFDLGRYPSGESKDVVFDEPGVAKIYCEVHDYMRAAVIVVENPFFQIAGVGENLRFRLEGVPAGTYRLVVWHPELRPYEGDVTVSEGGVARVPVTLN